MYDTQYTSIYCTVFRKENSPNILTKVLHWHDKLGVHIHYSMSVCQMLSLYQGLLRMNI
jgi:hypothetical protein